MAIQDRVSLRNIYLYLVCLVTLVISIFAAVNVVRASVELAYPDPTYHAVVEPPSKVPGVTEEEQRRYQQTVRDAQRRQSVLSLVGSATLLLIAGPVYLYHWRRVQAELPPKESR
ncbi:MAG TPA: hypothetical protein VFX61_02820 [Micromonosporaceae bacterium]|nr:hypothetical protein [Micromonosporaceae bacterium]